MNSVLEEMRGGEGKLSRGVFPSVILNIVLFVSGIISCDMTTLTIISVIQFSIGIYLIRNKTKSLVSVPCIFYVLCFLFHCTYFILIATENITGNVYYFITLPEDVQIRTLKVCLMFLFFYPIGCFLLRLSKIKSQKRFLTLYQCKKIGVFLVLLCLVPRLYVDFLMLSAYMSGGYLNTYGISINNYVIVFADMFYFGVLLALVGLRKEKSKAIAILLFAIAVIFVGMMSGRRAIKVVYLIAMLFVYFKYVNRKKIKFSTVLICAALGFLILAVIASFGDMRETGDMSFTLFWDSFVKNLTNKLLVDQFSEFGYAAYTLGASVEYFPTSSHGYGINYVASWLEIFPNIGGMLTGFSDKMSFVLKLPDRYQQALGGSVLGECYYNFGNFSFLAFLLLGYLISFFSINLEQSMKCNYLSYRGVLCLLILSPTILWVRSCFNEFPRAVVWSLIVLIVLRPFFKKGNV